MSEPCFVDFLVMFYNMMNSSLMIAPAPVTDTLTPDPVSAPATTHDATAHDTDTHDEDDATDNEYYDDKCMCAVCGDEMDGIGPYGEYCSDSCMRIDFEDYDY